MPGVRADRLRRRHPFLFLPAGRQRCVGRHRLRRRSAGLPAYRLRLPVPSSARPLLIASAGSVAAAPRAGGGSSYLSTGINMLKHSLIAAALGAAVAAPQVHASDKKEQKEL